MSSLRVEKKSIAGSLATAKKKSEMKILKQKKSFLTSLIKIAAIILLKEKIIQRLFSSPFRGGEKLFIYDLTELFTSQETRVAALLL